MGGDRRRLGAAVAEATRAGVSLRRLGPADAEAAAGLHTAHRADFPSTPATEAARYEPAGMAELLTTTHAVGAWAGESLVALTVLRRPAVETGAPAETEFTLTRADHRGRGLATAVKAAAVLDLAREGVQRFATGGAQVNAAILAVNRHLGYVVEPLWLTLTAMDSSG